MHDLTRIGVFNELDQGLDLGSELYTFRHRFLSIVLSCMVSWITLRMDTIASPQTCFLLSLGM